MPVQHRSRAAGPKPKNAGAAPQPGRQAPKPMRQAPRGRPQAGRAQPDAAGRGGTLARPGAPAPPSEGPFAAQRSKPRRPPEPAAPPLVSGPAPAGRCAATLGAARAPRQEPD